MIRDLIDRLRCASPKFWRGVVVLGVAFVVLYSLTARARDPDGRYAGSPNASWFKSQHNEKGEWCCDEADGERYDGPYALNDDGSVVLFVDGGPVTLPAYMVLKGPNPTGHAIWWHIGASSYCFAPGALS